MLLKPRPSVLKFIIFKNLKTLNGCIFIKRQIYIVKWDKKGDNNCHYNVVHVSIKYVQYLNLIMNTGTGMSEYDTYVPHLTQ